MRECDFLIVGAGIAGDSAGHFFAKKHKVIILQREEQPGYHTTGRSVAVYTEAYGPRPVRALVIAGGPFFREPPAGFTDAPLCHPHGFMFIGREDQRRPACAGGSAKPRAPCWPYNELQAKEGERVVYSREWRESMPSR